MSSNKILQENWSDMFNTHEHCAVFCRTRCGHAPVRNRCSAGWGGGKIPQRHPIQQCDCQQPTASHAGETDSFIFNYGSVAASLKLKYPDITSRLQSGHHTHRLCDSDRSITALLLLSADCLKQVVYWSVRLCGLVAVSGDILYLSSHQKEQGTDPLSDLSLPLLSRD